MKDKGTVNKSYRTRADTEFTGCFVCGSNKFGVIGKGQISIGVQPDKLIVISG